MSGEEGGPEIPKETQEEAPISEWGIGQVKQRLSEISELKEQMKEPLPEKEFEELLDESHQLNARKKELLSVGTREAVNIARLIKDGTLRNEDIERAFKRIEQTHPDNFELQEANFDLVRAEYTKLERMVKEASEEEIKEFPLILRQYAESLKKYEKKGLTPEEVKESQKVTGKMMEMMGAGGLMSGMERPPDVKEGVKAFRDWFDQKIHSLIEEYPDQSFETNWMLVYPLQQAVNSLWPKGEEGEIITDEKGVQQKDSGENPYTYSGLRKDLALELESHRNLHNYMFLHRRVSGVDGTIPASALLESRYLECLMNKPEVANALRKLERLGEVYKESKDRVFEGGLTKVEEAEEKSNQNRIFNEMSTLQRENWAGIVAGGLYSGLHEAARHDIIFNESGDFFLSRVFNMPDRVKDLWEEKWHRDPAPNFYNALDLRTSGFWRTILKEQYNFFKMQVELEGLKKGDEEIKKEATKRFKEFCEQFTIAPTKEIPTAKKGDYFLIKEGYYSLKDADFEHIKFVGEKKENCLGTKTDEVKVVDLNLMDADEIRKLILNPGRLVERPGLDHIKEIWQPFKHLKGEARSRWFKGVVKQIILLFKDKTAPDIENLPEAARRCPAKKIYPEVSAWLNPQIVLAVENLAPPLTKKDADDLLEDVVGPKPVREAKKYGKAAISAAVAMASEFTKALLGIK